MRRSLAAGHVSIVAALAVAMPALAAPDSPKTIGKQKGANTPAVTGKLGFQFLKRMES